MTTYNNNGLFGNVHTPVDAIHMEHELVKRLSKEKHRLAAELEIKYEEASIKHLKAQEKKLKQLFEQEKQRYQAALKEKYSNIVNNMLHEKEHKIAEQYKNEYNLLHAKLNKQVKLLQQQLAQQEQNINITIHEAEINAKQEQKQACRVMYDKMLQEAYADAMWQAEQKQEAGFLKHEIELKHEYELNLKKHTSKIISEYEDKLRNALFKKEQELTLMHNEQAAKQSELFNERIKQEVNCATNEIISNLQNEFDQEKQNLNAIIESMQPEVEANKIRLRTEVEQELRSEFTAKHEQYKDELEKNKHIELEELMATEKHKLAEIMQEENIVVLKYKEREIRENLAVEYEQNWQTKLQQALQEQEQKIRIELNEQLEQTISTLKAEHAAQLEAELLKERARIAENDTSETMLLLQQQKVTMEEIFKQELALKLEAETQRLNEQYQEKIQILNIKLQQANNLPPIDIENSIQNALDEQEQRLYKQFAQRLSTANNQAQYNIHAIDYQQELIAREKKLRREFQAILEEQRRKKAINFARQRDKEIHEALETYKKNEIMEIEKSLQEEYSTRLQKHAELMRIETERMKDSLKAAQSAKIQSAVDQQLEAIHKAQEIKFTNFVNEQEEKLELLVEEQRKKINIKFAQDKALLIKDLTDRFTREKHISMDKHETELREKLHKEMVKQKEFIQTKFTQVQETALQEQKRQLEAKHKHEIERIKQGYFDPAAESNYDDNTIGHNVEQLAEKILSKFQRNV